MKIRLMLGCLGLCALLVSGCASLSLFGQTHTHTHHHYGCDNEQYGRSAETGQPTPADEPGHVGWNKAPRSH